MESKKPKVSKTNKGKLMLLLKCAMGNRNKIEKGQEASGSLSRLGLKTPSSKISVLGWDFSELLMDEESRKPPFQNLSHKYYNNETSTVIPCLKKIQKNINHVTHSLSSADIRNEHHRKLATFIISRNTDVDCTLMPNF